MNTLRIFPLQGHRKDIHDIAEQLTEALPKGIDARLRGFDNNEKCTYYFSKNCAWGILETRKFVRVEFSVLSDVWENNTTIYVSSQEALDIFIKGNKMKFDKFCNNTNYKVNL